MEKFRNVKHRLYNSKITSEQASSSLSRTCTRQELAEFIVDAFDRGWISNFNVGLDSDGDPI